MTDIVDFKTKKELKEAIASNEYFLIERTGFGGDTGLYYRTDTIAEGASVYVTNHPKRSWFAQISRKDGKLIVK